MLGGFNTGNKMQLIHGDCLEKMKDIQDGYVDCILTDPPYVMTPQGNSCRPNYMHSGMSKNLFGGQLPDFDIFFQIAFKKLASDSHLYCFSNVNSLQELLNAGIRAGFKLSNILHMIKDTKMPNRWYLKYTEMVLFFRKGRAFPINNLTSRDYDFVEMPTVKKGKVHISQKPILYLEKLIVNSSKEGGTILDPFMGSGSTGIACLNTNRNFIGIEKDDKYFEIAKNRINNHLTNGDANTRKSGGE